MQPRFCGKCGKPIAECTCHHPALQIEPSMRERAGRSGSYYIDQFDDIALIQGEQVVREYHIGEFAKLLGPAGKGRAKIIITNKRVINKQDTDYLGSSSSSIQEIMLDNIAGVESFYSQGYTIWRLVVAGLAGLIGLIMFFGAFGGYYGFDFKQFLVGLIFLGVGVYMAIKSRKPSYMFGVYAASTSIALATGVNLRGKLQNAGGYGILFQFKPTKDAIRMMRELCACIVDLKTKGDYAIEAWKNKA